MLLVSRDQLRAEANGQGWHLVGGESTRLELANDFLASLVDRNYSPRTVRSYAFDLLDFVRFLEKDGIAIEQVRAEVLLRCLAACRQVPRRGGENVFSIDDGRNAGYAPSTINRRLAAISGLYGFASLRDPAFTSPVPKGRAENRTARRAQSGLLGHLARPRTRSALRVREPRRLPRALDRSEAAALIGSLKSWRDRAIAGLMLYSGLRSCEVLGLSVRDVDIGGRWVQILGKGNKKRRVPIDVEVAGVIQTYLLAERPATDSTRLFVVAKGPNRGKPLSPEGLRAVFRYHRRRSGVVAGHPHALRHSFGTALAEAGVDLAVMQALLGHDHVDSTAAYIHLAPAHLRREFDTARARQRSRA